MKFNTEKIKLFLGGVYNEAKKVDWPNRQQTIRYTAIVLAICVSTAIFLGIVDYLLLKLMQISIFH